MTTPLNIVIEKNKSILGTEALLLVPLAWMEMIETKTIDQFTIPTGDWQEVVYARASPGQVVGLIAFQELKNELWLCLSYVKPEFRRQGVHSRLFAYLETLAKERECVRISGGTWNTNIGMQKAFASTGRTSYAQYWKKDLV